MANYSYNELKTEFEDLHENWMPAKLPPFQAPSSNNTSNADSKIYTKSQYRSAVSFFADERALNPFCKRVNCYNINLEHTHSHPETKQEYAKKVVRFLKKWQSKARGENSLDQTELSQLSKVIKFWEKKNSFKDQEEALLEHYNQTVFRNPVNSQICLEITNKLKKEIQDGRITDDTNQPDPGDFVLCNLCGLKNATAYSWETSYREEIEKNCRADTHLQSPSEIKTKIHNKCWKKVEENNFHDIKPHGCSNAKSSDLLEATPRNLVKSFFILKGVKSIKKDPLITIDPFIHIDYLDGHNQVVNSVRQIGDYEDLKTYLNTLLAGQELTRKDLGIEERDNPDDDLNLEEVREKILSYFREHGIESIRLKNNKLVIKYNFKEEEEPNLPELQQIQSYLQAKGVNFLTLNDLKKGNNNQESGYAKLLFYGGITVAIAFVVGLIAYLAYRSEKNRPRGY